MAEVSKEVAERVAQLSKALVLGAGTMGSGIARLLASAGFTVNLVDPFEKNLHKTAEKLGIGAAQRFTALTAESLREVDLVIEAATENREIKKRDVYEVLGRIHAEGGLRDGILIGTNTSSIPITELSRSLPPALRNSFMGTHFFNPAHYMKLLELIPGELTSPETTAVMTALAVTRLNKEVAVAADLPGFIVNRLLIFDFGNQLQDISRGRYSFEEIDAVMGAPVGRPMGPFQLGDLVGIDLFAPIGKVIYEGVPSDPLRNSFIMPEFLDRMTASGKLGAKSGGLGFYRNEGRRATGVYDLVSGEYKPLSPVSFASVQAALCEKDALRRIEALLFAESADRGREIARRYLLGLLNYTRRLIDVIGDAAGIETGVLYGLNHKIGPVGLLTSPLGPSLRELSRRLWDETGDRLYEVV